jgi:hypothetical protein
MQSGCVVACVSLFLTISGTAAAQNCSASVANKPGDTIQVTATLFSTDPNENGEGEPLSVSSSGGDFTTVISFYNSPQSFSYKATQSNDTLTGVNIGADGDESCTLSAMVTNSPKYTPAQKAQFTNLSNQANELAADLAIVTALCAPIALVPGATPVSIMCVTGFGVDSGLAWKLSAKYAMLAADPPDPNYMQIAVPVIPPVPTVKAGPGLPAPVAAAQNELVSDMAELDGIQGALITSINRASGAQLANNAYWYKLQSQAVSTYSDSLSGYLARAAAAANALQRALVAAGATYSITVSEAVDFEAYVASNGLPTEVIDALKSLGASQTDIENFTNIAIVQDVNALAVPITGSAGLLGSFGSSLNSLAQTTGGSCTEVNMIRAAFGQTSNKPGFIAAADLNNDGVINVTDLALAAKSLAKGTTCP